MENGQSVGTDVESKEEKRKIVEDICDDLQKRIQMPASWESEFVSTSQECENDVPDGFLVSANETSQIGAECEQSQVLMLSETPEKLESSSCSRLESATDKDCPQVWEIPEKLVVSSSSNGLEEVQDKDSAQEWKLDKSLPPIKVRREGQSRDSSSSDLSPPSPKRMRQGSQERGDQWLGFWSPDEIK